MPVSQQETKHQETHVAHSVRPADDSINTTAGVIWSPPTKEGIRKLDEEHAKLTKKDRVKRVSSQIQSADNLQFEECAIPEIPPSQNEAPISDILKGLEALEMLKNEKNRSKKLSVNKGQVEKTPEKNQQQSKVLKETISNLCQQEMKSPNKKALTLTTGGCSFGEALRDDAERRQAKVVIEPLPDSLSPAKKTETPKKTNSHAGETSSVGRPGPSPTGRKQKTSTPATPSAVIVSSSTPSHQKDVDGGPVDDFMNVIDLSGIDGDVTVVTSQVGDDADKDKAVGGEQSAAYGLPNQEETSTPPQQQNFSKEKDAVENSQPNKQQPLTKQAASSFPAHPAVLHSYSNDVLPKVPVFKGKFYTLKMY